MPKAAESFPREMYGRTPAYQKLVPGDWYIFLLNESRNRVKGDIIEHKFDDGRIGRFRVQDVKSINAVETIFVGWKE